MLPWINKALEAGYSDSEGILRRKLAQALLLADEKNRDDARMFRILNQLNKEGLLEMPDIAFLSVCYAEGMGTDKDPVLAEKLFPKIRTPQNANPWETTQIGLSAVIYIIRHEYDKAGAALLKCGRTDCEIIVYAMGWSVSRDDDKAFNLAREYMKTDEGKKYLENDLLPGAPYPQLANGPIPNADDTSDARVCELIEAILAKTEIDIMQNQVEEQIWGTPVQSRRLFWLEKAAKLGSSRAPVLISRQLEIREQIIQNAPDNNAAPLSWIECEWNLINRF